MSRPARTLPDEPEASADPLAEAYARREEYPLTRRPGLSPELRARLLWAGLGAGAVLLWIIVGRAVMRVVAG